MLKRQDLNADFKLSFADDDTYDTVLISNAMEFFTDPRQLLREVNRYALQFSTVNCNYLNYNFDLYSSICEVRSCTVQL
jgi:hypothetical protein